MAAKKTSKKTTPAKQATKKAAKKAAKRATKKNPKKAVSFDEIAAEAYYIYRERSANGLPGNPESDWLTAEKKLHC